MSEASRARPAQGPADRDLSGFPRKNLPAGRRWYRQHGPAGPWFFDSSTQGRFNLDSPRGTLYLASTPEGAARERIGFDLAATGWVPAGLVRDRVMSVLDLSVTCTVAYLTAGSALEWGVVSNELATTDDYALTRSWACAFDAAGFDGLWGRLRFSAGRGRALALFGDEGTRPWPVDPHPRTLRDVVELDMLMHVVDAPSSTSLTILSD
ncbi:RES family NAD+ phosphorylase [Cellulomonas sp. HZM]|uniref:RES family NAD+ phosphorylase n=1 Tax=Cellulomonas sp. HZM TaxID=1454010 RepID=UPI000A57CB0A|nr:RES family NAD+ phosphorylase [Cellulomonas sp. HZM]